MNTNYKLYLYKPGGLNDDFLGELLVDNLNADIKLHDISTITFTIPETINGVVNPRIDEVLDSYIVELRYGRDLITVNGEYSSIRFVIRNTPLDFSDNMRKYSYTGFSLESLLEFKNITSWAGVEVKDFFRTVTYDNAVTDKFTEPGSPTFEYTLSAASSPSTTQYITISPTTETATPLDIFIYEVREDTVTNAKKEVPYIRYNGSGINEVAFRPGYYFLVLDANGNVDSIRIAVPGNYDEFDEEPSTKKLYYKVYDNPLSRHFAIGVNRNTADPYTDMYIELAREDATGETPSYGGYTFSTQEIYSKNGLSLEQVLLGRVDIKDDEGDYKTVTDDGLLYSTQFTLGYVDPFIAGDSVNGIPVQFRSNLEYNNITRYQAIKDLADSFDAIVVFNTINKTVSFYPQDNTLTDAWPNNGLIIKYGTYLQSITKEIDASKIVTSAKALGKDNLTIALITPDGNDSWEDFSYYLDNYYVKYDRENLLDMDYDAEKGVTYNSFPTGNSSRWMEPAEALNVAKWQYARDYFHDILLGNLEPDIEEHEDYYDLYNSRSEKINEFVSAETEFISWRAQQYQYKYLYDYYNNLKQNESASEEDLVRLEHYEDLWLGTNGNNGAEVAIAAEFTRIENLRKNIFDDEVPGSLAETLKKVRDFLDKDEWGINLTKLDSFIRQTVMSDNKHDNEFDLLKATIIHVNENKVPKVTLKTNIVSIISAQEAYEDWNKLKAGDLINIYFDEFNIDLVAQIKEISINFEEHTVDLVISTVHDYNTTYRRSVSKLIRKLYNSNSNITKHLEDSNRVSSEESQEVYNQITNGTILADNANIAFGSVDTEGNRSSTFSAVGASSLVISQVDPILEVITFTSDRGVAIADGAITAYYDRGSSRTEVEVSGANGFVIRNIDSNDVTQRVAYIDQGDGSAYFAGWKLDPGQFSSGTNTSFVGINSEIPDTGNSVYAFWAGDGTASSAPFSVTKSGNIKATSGNLSGLTIGTGTYIDDSGEEPVSVSKNAIFTGTGVWGADETPFYLDEDGRFSLSDELTWNPETNTFFVNGTIEANVGEIGGWSVDSTSISSGDFILKSNANTPYLSIGQVSEEYEAEGIFLGMVSNGEPSPTYAPKFSLVSAGDNYLKWTGEDLLINGNLGGEISAINIESASQPNTGVFITIDGIEGKKDNQTNFSLSAGNGDGTIARWNFDDKAIYTGTYALDGEFSISGITIGTTTEGGGYISAENFRIDSDGSAFFTGFVSINQDDVGYDQQGIFIGKDNEVSKFSLVSGNTSMVFDPSATDYKLKILGEAKIGPLTLGAIGSTFLTGIVGSANPKISSGFLGPNILTEDYTFTASEITTIAITHFLQQFGGTITGRSISIQLLLSSSQVYPSSGLVTIVLPNTAAPNLVEDTIFDIPNVNTDTIRVTISGTLSGGGATGWSLQQPKVTIPSADIKMGNFIVDSEGIMSTTEATFGNSSRDRIRITGSDNIDPSFISTIRPLNLTEDRTLSVPNASGVILVSTDDITYPTSTGLENIFIVSRANSSSDIELVANDNIRLQSTNGVRFYGATVPSSGSTNYTRFLRPNQNTANTINVPASNGTLSLLESIETLTGKKTFTSEPVFTAGAVFGSAADAANSIEITSSGSIIFEGSTADANETRLVAANSTRDLNTITLPDSDGTLHVWYLLKTDAATSISHTSTSSTTTVTLNVSGASIAVGDLLAIEVSSTNVSTLSQRAIVYYRVGSTSTVTTGVAGITWVNTQLSTSVGGRRWYSMDLYRSSTTQLVARYCQFAGQASNSTLGSLTWTGSNPAYIWRIWKVL